MSGVDDDVMELGVFTSPTLGGTKTCPLIIEMCIA